jgi:hypothetical protein
MAQLEGECTTLLDQAREAGYDIDRDSTFELEQQGKRQ